MFPELYNRINRALRNRAKRVKKRLYSICIFQTMQINLKFSEKVHGKKWYTKFVNASTQKRPFHTRVKLLPEGEMLCFFL